MLSKSVASAAAVISPVALAECEGLQRSFSRLARVRSPREIAGVLVADVHWGPAANGAGDIEVWANDLHNGWCASTANHLPLGVQRAQPVEVS